MPKSIYFSDCNIILYPAHDKLLNACHVICQYSAAVVIFPSSRTKNKVWWSDLMVNETSHLGDSRSLRVTQAVLMLKRLPCSFSHRFLPEFQDNKVSISSTWKCCCTSTRRWRTRSSSSIVLGGRRMTSLSRILLSSLCWVKVLKCLSLGWTTNVSTECFLEILIFIQRISYV